MINDAINEYDFKVGSVRHKENGEKFGKLFEALNQLKGVIYAFGAAGSGIIALFGLWEHFKH